MPCGAKNRAKTGTATIWMSPRKMRLPVIFAKKIVTRSTGQSSRPSSAPSSFSWANERLSPSRAPKTKTTQSMPPV